MTKISRFARNDDTGKALGAATVFSFHCLLHGGKDFGLFPPSSGRRCPEGAEVGSRSSDEKLCETARPPVSSSQSQSSISLPQRCTAFMRQYRKSPSCLVFPSSHTLPFTGVQGRFLALLEMTIRGTDVSELPVTSHQSIEILNPRLFKLARFPMGIP